MTTSPSHNGANGTRWPSPVPCPALPFAPSEPTDFRRDGLVEDVDALEAAALMRAFDEGNATLREFLWKVNDAGGDAELAYQRAGGAIDALDRLRDARRVEEAATQHAAVLARHADDGPEDRRRRTLAPWVVWAVLLVAAVFDASFVGNLMQRILGVGPHSLLYYLAYLPGIGMALCLLVSGTTLAENLYRRRVWLTRRPHREALNPWIGLCRILWQWRPERQERAADDLPWYRTVLPLVSVVATIGLLGVIAYIRAMRAGAEFTELKDLQPAFVVLLLLLSISAVGVKVLSHNPCADRSEAATRGLTRMSTLVDRSATSARTAVADAVKATHRLSTMIVDAESAARSTVERACARMLDERGRRNETGAMVLPLVFLRWPSDEAGQGADRTTDLPGLNLALLDDARRMATRYRPEPLRLRLARTIDDIHRQFHASNGRDLATADDPSATGQQRSVGGPASDN